MNRQDSIFLTGLAVFSGLTSFVLVYYSIGIWTGGDATRWDRVFAYVAAGYGLGNVYILSWAWRNDAAWPVWANKLIAFCFFAAFLLDMWKTGVESALEYVGALAMAFILWLNWLAVKKCTERWSRSGLVQGKPTKLK
jgi:hypothetical protein